MDIIKERREKADTSVNTAPCMRIVQVTDWIVSQDKIDMLHFLTDTYYKDGTKVTDKQVAHMMIALLMAGQHTSAVTGSWFLLHLAANPVIQFVSAQ